MTLLACVTGSLFVLLGFVVNDNNKNQNFQIFLTAFGIIAFVVGAWNGIISELSELLKLLVK
ncbi:MAG: hypothetical protein Q8N59_03355 [bacterium]|nr:hypothetical protein [bacterium]